MDVSKNRIKEKVIKTMVKVYNFTRTEAVYYLDECNKEIDI